MLILMIIVVLVLGVVLRALQVRWGFDSIVDVLHFACARMVPAASMTPRSLIRKMNRRLPGVFIVSANGTHAAAGTITVYVSPTSFDVLERGFPVELLEEDLAASYLEHARSQGWRLPLAGVRVAIEEDSRLRSGWVRMTGAPGAYAHSQQGVVARPIARSSRRRAHGDPDTVTRTLPTVAFTAQETLADEGIAFIWRFVAEADAVALPPIASGQFRIVGRDRSAGAVVDHLQVSRTHLRLSVTGPVLVVEDLGSTNGTFIDGERLPKGEPREVAEGALLAFGRSGPRYRLASSKTPLVADVRSA